MKTLIENTIKINGIPNSSTKTVFTITDESQRTDPNFMNLAEISGRRLSVQFSYNESGNVVRSLPLVMTIPVSTDETTIKNFITTTINQSLSN